MPADDNERQKMLSRTLLGSLETLVSSPLVDPAKEVLQEFENTGTWARQRIVKAPEATVQWFVKTCMSIFQKYLDNPEISERMLACYEEMGIYASKYQKKKGRPKLDEQAVREVARR